MDLFLEAKPSRIQISQEPVADRRFFLDQLFQAAGRPVPGAILPATSVCNSAGLPACRACPSSPAGGKSIPGNRRSLDPAPARTDSAFRLFRPAFGSATAQTASSVARARLAW